MTETLNIAEVQNAIRTLSQHGLGAYKVHMHDENGEMVPLRSGMVQLEKDLQVSFVPGNSIDLKDAEAVAWQWKENKIETVAYCGRCGRDD